MGTSVVEKSQCHHCHHLGSGCCLQWVSSFLRNHLTSVKKVQFSGNRNGDGTELSTMDEGILNARIVPQQKKKINDVANNEKPFWVKC